MELEIEFVEFSTENDFYYIASILSEKLNFRCLKKIEGPDANICEFASGNLHFWLVWDDMAGNFLKTEKIVNLEKLTEVFRKVETVLQLNNK